jgi:hypothetical protein
VTEFFPGVVQEHFHYSTEETLTKLFSNSRTEAIEYAILKQCNHYHQADVICLAPVESFIKSANRPQLNVGDIYMLNTRMVLLFLH